MSLKEPNIIFYLPYDKDSFSKEDNLWLINFQTILKTTLEQIIQQKINIYNPFIDSSDFENTPLNTPIHAVFIQLIINSNYKTEKLIQHQASKLVRKIFQLNCLQIDTAIPAMDNIHSINFFNEKNGEKIDFSGRAGFVNDQNVWLKIMDLSYEIKEYFLETKSQQEGNITIYLAQTNDDLNDERESILREFKHMGYHILPEENFPDDVETYHKFVQENIRKADFSIHLIGNVYEPAFERISRSAVEIQNELFNQLIQKPGHKNIRRLVWIPQIFRPDSEKQRLYVENFKHRVEFLDNTEIIQTPLEVFKSLVKRYVDQNNSGLRQEQDELSFGQEKKVYFIHSNVNSSDHVAIINALNAKNLEVLELKDHKNKIELIQKHHSLLKMADAILIDYSSGNPFWLKSKLSDLKKVPGLGKKTPFLAKAILLEKTIEPPFDPGIDDVLLIYRDSDLSASLKPFTEKIK
ncbi:MAG: hypothetical protein V2I54_12085 [Bacteroidales bacterium]|jgi:hypothetical protein|nr:hypothetical protein [Bacteroidales bacterium]